MKSTIRRAAPKASLGDELESAQTTKHSESKTMCKSPEAKGSRPQRKPGQNVVGGEGNGRGELNRKAAGR